MDSPTALSRYIPQNSKKRVCLSSGSSSACKEVEALELSPPASSRSSKSKSSKQKEVICHEIIDVDMEKDCDDASLTDSEVDRSAKGKKVLSSSSVGVSSLANEESGNDTLTSSNGAAGLNDSTDVDDLSSNLFYGEDEWLDTYYDDIIYDDDTMLESHFDHMDIPPGVEAPFPWLPSSPQNDAKVPAASPSGCPSTQIKDLSTSWGNSTSGIQLNVVNQHTNGKPLPKWTEPTLGQKISSSLSSMVDLSSQLSSGSSTHKSGKEPWQSSGKYKKKHHASYKQLFSTPMHPSSVSGGGSTLNMPPNAVGVGNSVTMWQDLPLDMYQPSLGPSGYMNESSGYMNESSGYMNESSFSSWKQNSANNVNGASSIETSLPIRAGQRNMDEILHNFDHFKKFDTVEDYSDHHYCRYGILKQPPKNWAKRIQEEWKILENDLPDEIFVRVYESRMDLLRAVIIGAEGTPYHDGLFFFDVFFPSSYPNVPPHVHYHSGGLRINPNLYNCGKVCLSLLNTWSGNQKEKWIPGVSTMLQVLVSIQGLILNAKPYFNEPGYEATSGTDLGEKRSLDYNEKTFMYSLQTMVYNMRRPPKNFEDFVIGYFSKHARDILVSCKAYLDGAQVGCLVRGGVQDVDEGDKSCSQRFKHDLAGFITTLVNVFSGIGAKDCEEFLSLANRANGTATAAPRALNLFN